jgi:FixJ family two-component response regulator
VQYDAQPALGILPPLRVERYHIFLLVTTVYCSARIGIGNNSALQSKDAMTDQPSGFVVAVVDDDRGILRSLEYLLESADYSVRLFTSATALLDSGCLPEIDCLISDIDMPGMDGFELLRLVHAARPELPTILITGYPDRLKRLPPLGGSNLRSFTKPFAGPELLAAVSDALRNSPS